MSNAFTRGALVAGFIGCASLVTAQTPSNAAAGAPVEKRIIESGFTKLTATVEAVDLAKREVTLREAGKEPFTISVDEAVKNLAEVKKGDVVNATFAESLAYELRPPGQAPPAGAQVSGQSGKPGEKPKGVSTRRSTVTVTVTAIDPKAPSVTFNGPKGVRTIRVTDPGRLAGVKVGQTIELTYTEALAFSVEKARTP